MKKDIIITDELIDDFLICWYGPNHCHDPKELDELKDNLKDKGYQVEEKKSSLEKARTYILETRQALYWEQFMIVCRIDHAEDVRDLYEKAITELQKEIEELKRCNKCDNIHKTCDNCNKMNLGVYFPYGCEYFQNNLRYCDLKHWEPKE